MAISGVPGGRGQEGPEGQRTGHQVLPAGMVDEADAERAGDQADAEYGGQEPVGAAVAVKCLACQHGQDDREIEGEQPDQRHHDERQPQLLAAGRVPRARMDAAGRPPPSDAGPQRAQHHQRGDHGHV